MRILFMGTPEIAVPSLEALHEAGHEIALVVCQPDKKAGRGRRQVLPPVKLAALERGFLLFQPKTVRHAVPQRKLRDAAPEVIVVVAYGKILPSEILELPPMGCINLHASLLPELRGAAPIQWAIAAGYQETGVTTMLMDEGLDTGPILLQRPLRISPREDAPSLAGRMGEAGAQLLVETLDLWSRGGIEPRQQDSGKATFAPILAKGDGEIDWGLPAVAIDCRVRGFRPWPGCFSWSPKGPLKIHRCRVAEGSGPPGRLLEIKKEGLLVGTGKGALLLEEVQPRSRRRMSATAYARGYGIRAGLDFRGEAD